MTVLKFITLVYALILTAILGWLGLNFDDKGVSDKGESVANAAIYNVM